MTKFYIDNNIFRRVTERDNVHLLKKWEVHTGTSGLLPAGLIVTYFSLLEGLGIVAPQIPKFLGSLKGLSPGDVGVNVFDHAKQFLKESPVISLPNFQHRYEECFKRCSPEGGNYFDQCFRARSSSQGFVDTTKDALALDYMLEFHYPQSLFVRVHMVFWLQMVELWKKNGDYPSLRLFKKMYDRISRRKLWLIMAKQFYESLMKNTGLKLNQDLMDTELIQFVVAGEATTSGREVVHAHTSDPPEKIKDRIRLSKTVFQTIREKFDEEDLDSSAFDAFRPGFVHCYDYDTLDLIETMEVSTIPVL